MQSVFRPGPQESTRSIPFSRWKEFQTPQHLESMLECLEIMNIYRWPQESTRRIQIQAGKSRKNSNNASKNGLLYGNRFKGDLPVWSGIDFCRGFPSHSV